MKKIYKIAKAELALLFYSPVAWLILLVFTFQIGLVAVNITEQVIRGMEQGYRSAFLTNTLLAGRDSIFVTMAQYLYLYMPLLTMGLMSREYASGTIKLLYSAPITARDIILGNFFGMIAYGFILMCIVLMLILGFSFGINGFDYDQMWTGLLGLYLLLCAYSAIGLFVSTLTSYQVVAAVGTLVVLAILNFLNKIGQDITFVRDITYWLCLADRSNSMMGGMLSSEDLVYYLMVIILFLMLSIFKLQSTRQTESVLKTCSKYVGIIALVMLVGYVSSRPVCLYYWDVTETKRNTLTPTSQEIMRKLDGNMTITTYVNFWEDNYYFGMPTFMNNDLERFKQYLRFKPEIKMKYVYYYKSASPVLNVQYPGLSDKERMEKLASIRNFNPKMFISEEELRKTIDLSGEGYRFIRVIERENGQRAFLRIFDDIKKFPGEAEMGVTFKRFTTRLPIVGFLTGHGEPSVKEELTKDYSLFANTNTYRNSLINQGFDVQEVSISGENDIPDNISILVIADMKTGLTDMEKDKLDRYISSGRNLVLLGRSQRQDLMNPLLESFGVKLLPGTLVQPFGDKQPDELTLTLTKEAGAMYNGIREMLLKKPFIYMQDVAGLEYATDRGFTVQELAHTDTITTWNEMETIDFVNDSVRFNPSAAEVKRNYPVALALSRMLNGQEQRIFIASSSTAFSNQALAKLGKGQANSTFLIGTFCWLSHGEAPIDVSRPLGSDNDVTIQHDSFPYIRIVCLGILPGLLLICGILIWIYRKRR